METAQFNRALSQLYSVLRDLGIATRGLARYETTGNPADPAPLGFPRHVQAGAQHLLDTWQSLDGVLVAEGFDPLPDPDEPGASLCQAARTAITAWRQPAGTSTDRDTTMERLIAALGFLATAARMSDHQLANGERGASGTTSDVNTVTQALPSKEKTR